MMAKKSNTKKSCTCAVCVRCCQSNPGWPTPNEARAAIMAGFAGRYMRDWLEPCNEVGNKDRIYVLAPASIGCEGADAPEMDIGDIFSIFTNAWTKGRCNFLKNGLCEIHDSGFKPRQCRETLACEVNDGGKPASDNYTIARLWNTAKGRSVVTEWGAVVSSSKVAAE